jgi:hypothetical protein
MATALQTTTDLRVRNAFAWLPLLVLPTAAALVAADGPAWILMWALAISIYAGFKWLTFVDCAEAGRASVGRSIGYLVFWPGMNARQFLAGQRNIPPPAASEWLSSVAKAPFGLILIYGIAPAAATQGPLFAGWIGMIGLVFVLHFGVFHLLSVAWRQAGIAAEPVMNNPLMAASLTDFWGRRWNIAFRDLAHDYVFRPVSKPWGLAAAALAAFLVSGLIHDVVMSIPAGGGFGRPTLYFCIQGVGLVLERSKLGKRLGLGQGFAGRLFCAIVTIAPVGLLFHPPFVNEVIIPALNAMRAL